jgi:16S rRNA C967 or C1407 C5-methylase (RsmB/RsmF family)
LRVRLHWGLIALPFAFIAAGDCKETFVSSFRNGQVLEEALALALGPLRPPDRDLVGMARAASSASPRSIRLSQTGGALGLKEVPFSTRPVPWFPHAGAIIEDPLSRPAGHLLYATGAYYVQDAGSLLPLAAMEVRPGQLICDLCASPGGKTTALLDQLGPTGGVVANEVIQSRLPPLLLNAARCGATRFVVTNMDAGVLAGRLPNQFDAVLMDAPCSGQSLVGRGKQTARAYGQRTIKHCAGRQRRILDAAARLVKPGGHMVYTTCTFAWAENEQQIVDFIGRTDGWTIEPVASLNPWQSPPPSPEGCYRLWPHLDDSAGVFVSRLRRATSAETGGQEPLLNGNLSTMRRTSPQKAPDPFSFPLQVGRWQRAVTVRRVANRWEAWPGDVPALLTAMGGWGPEAAFRKGQTWFPAYGLAMRRDGSFLPEQTIGLGPEEALAYVRGDPIANDTLGWTVVAYQGRPLGWAHGSGRQLTNHLPPSARIINPYA